MHEHCRDRLHPNGPEGRETAVEDCIQLFHQKFLWYGITEPLPPPRLRRPRLQSHAAGQATKSYQRRYAQEM